MTDCTIRPEHLEVVLTAVSDRICSIHKAIARERDAALRAEMRLERDALIEIQLQVGRAM